MCESEKAKKKGKYLSWPFRAHKVKNIRLLFGFYRVLESINVTGQTLVNDARRSALNFFLPFFFVPLSRCVQQERKMRPPSTFSVGFPLASRRTKAAAAGSHVPVCRRTVDTRSPYTRIHGAKFVCWNRYVRDWEQARTGGGKRREKELRTKWFRFFYVRTCAQNSWKIDKRKALECPTHRISPSTIFTRLSVHFSSRRQFIHCLKHTCWEATPEFCDSELYSRVSALYSRPCKCEIYRRCV